MLPGYHSSLIPDGANTAALTARAERYYGFVPVSPDGSAYLHCSKSLLKERRGRV
jgi:hypothetical protein